MRGVRIIRVIALLAFLFPASLSICAAAADDVLTNADIVKMSKAGLSEDIILREIQVSKSNFGTSPSALIDLKKQGVSDRVLGAILDTHAGGGYSRSEAVTKSHLSQANGHRGLPNFKADVHVNSKVNEQVSMSHNQIRVEQGGVPIFSVHWEGNPFPKDNK